MTDYLRLFIPKTTEAEVMSRANTEVNAVRFSFIYAIRVRNLGFGCDIGLHVFVKRHSSDVRC